MAGVIDQIILFIYLVIIMNPLGGHMNLTVLHFGNCSILVQFWCSYSTVPLNIIVTQVRVYFPNYTVLIFRYVWLPASFACYDIYTLHYLNW